MSVVKTRGGKATTPDKLVETNQKRVHISSLLGMETHALSVAEMLSLPSPRTQCCHEGLTVHQTCFAAKQH